MTEDEALEAARKAWPGKQIEFIRQSADGTWRVSIIERVNVFYSFHRMGENGTPCCHKEGKECYPGEPNKTTPDS
jgi:hypothetical protein